MSNQLRAKRLGWAALSMLLLAVVVSWIWFATEEPPPARPMPNPNGYDRMTAAIAALLFSARPRPPLEPRSAPIEELQRAVADGEASLRLVDEALSMETRVPPATSVEELHKRTGKLGDLKRVALLIQQAGVLAERSDRLDEAAGTHLKGMKFGIEMMRGGFLIDGLVGIACQGIGLRALEPLAPRLSEATTMRLLEEVQRMDAGRGSMEEVMAAEKRFFRVAGSWQTRVMMRLTQGKALKEMEKRSLLKHNQIVLETRQFIITLAARAYELKHGRRPASASDLVPAFLKTMPTDPETGAPLPVR